MKFIVIGLVIYFIYKFMFRPALKEPTEKKAPIENNRDTKGNEEGEYIEYEEID